MNQFQKEHPDSVNLSRIANAVAVVVANTCSPSLPQRQGMRRMTAATAVASRYRDYETRCLPPGTPPGLSGVCLVLSQVLVVGRGILECPCALWLRWNKPAKWTFGI